ncbi:MAG: glycosyltransferase family 2 protein [Pseudomonadales bacterium]|mgnify:CR=1 FL=1|nr:glycosyltransferase family 2 protein [Pseudomonadales bacterium]
MRTTLVITTYERPDALRAVLTTVVTQSAQPTEIIVADDGSGDATGAVVREFQRGALRPLSHVWQEHDGFRLTRVRNLAILAATGDYLVFVDGDMLLHREFIADHVAMARRGYFSQGVRIPLSEANTAQRLATPQSDFTTPITRGARLRRLYGLHAPLLSRALRHVGNYAIAIKGCNQAYWREDLLRVNGFNEAIEGWGPEDKELAARLANTGVARQTLLFGGIAWHLHHPPASRDRRLANELVLRSTLAAGSVRCQRGLDAHQRNKAVS